MGRPAVPTPAVSALATRLKSVMTRRAGVALALYGEAGVGKSTVAHEVLQQVSCRSSSLHAARALAALPAELPQPSRLPLWARRTLERLVGGEHLDPQHAADALAALLAALAPIVLHVDDLHEAPAEGLELYTALAARVRRSRGVALLATSRTSPPAPFEACRVEPLSAEAARALLEQELGAAPPAAAAAWIYARTLGNALFTLEYLRYLTRQGYVWSDAKRWHWREPPPTVMPTTVEALIERLLYERLDGALEHALHAKAMLPLQASEVLWREVAGLEPEVLRGAALELERRGVLREGEFAHPLFREVARGQLGMIRRLLAQRAIVALCDEPEEAAAFVEDAALEPDAAAALLERAAQAAKEAGNEVRAARLLARAAVQTQGDRRGRLAFEAAKGLQSIDVHASIRLARMAADELQDPEAIHFLAGQLTVVGQGAEAEEVLARLPESERSGARWAKHLITVRGGAGDAASVVRLWHEYPALHHETDPRLAYAVGFSMVVLGQYRAADALAAQALPHAQGALERCRLLMVRGLAQTYLRAFGGAEPCFDEAVALAREGGMVSWRAAALYNRAIMLEYQGRYREMLSDLGEALVCYGEFGDGRRYASTQTKLARYLLERGDYERAEDLLLECRELLSRSDPSPFLVTCESTLAELYCEWRPLHAAILARKHAERALEYALALAIPAKLMQGKTAVARALAYHGDARQALTLADEALELARASEDPENVVLVLPVRAQALEALGRGDEAQRALAEAERLAAQQENALAVHRLGLELDRLRKDAAGAGERMAWFEARGLMHGVNLASRCFPELAREGARELEPSSALPRLELLGPMQLVRDGVSVAVHGHKRKELLATLLEARVAGRAEVSQLELLDALYPDEAEDVAAGALKQLVFQLRKSLGQGVILRTGSGYALGEVTSDVEAFLQGGATRLWRGSYREDIDGQGDETVAGAVHHALRLKIAERLGDDPAEAARLGQLLLRADPYDAEALRLTLRALQACGDRRGLEKLYEQGRRQLTEVGERLPEGWGSFLADRPL